MANLRIILGDQLSQDISSLEGYTKSDSVLMAEVNDENTYVAHHVQKLVFILSAMRHFAADIKKKGIDVHYFKLNSSLNLNSFTDAIHQLTKIHHFNKIIITEPGEYRVLKEILTWEKIFQVPVEIREDNRFLSSIKDFKNWAKGRKSLRMEFFYRELRKKTGWLMEGSQPTGGKWNFDQENRKALPKGHQAPLRINFTLNTITKNVMETVQTKFPQNFGKLDYFNWATTRMDALKALDHFIDECLVHYGTFQDAMDSENALLYHSLLSPYLNVGLLVPKEVCLAAIEAYEVGKVPINCVEGFVRQILGWREYIRGIYWLYMPEYEDSNYLEAKRTLPDFYWTADTQMNCLHQSITATRDFAYAHHIQRLMVTGNYALLTGIDPKEIEAWYLAVYIDAFDWVELPNTHGMAIFADGGLLASKPYAASGAYINRMSNYCKNCTFKVKEKSGKNACPFNYLYWNFIMEHESKLKRNPRMSLVYRNLSKKSPTEIEEIRNSTKNHLKSIH